jgi:phospholipase/lecithinase/hemolysin
MDQYINQTQTLYNSGARRFLFLTVPPIQYTPSVQAGGASNVEAEGAAVKQYNDALKSRVAAFAAANPQAKTYLVDTAAPFLKAIDDPKAYGADNATCFDASGTKCLWWNDVSLMLLIWLYSLFKQADCNSIIRVWLYRSSWLRRSRWR